MGDTGSGAEMLFGRRTYLDLVGHWLSTPDPNPFTEILRTTQKYVASRTLTEPLPHPASTLLAGTPSTRSGRSGPTARASWSSSAAATWCASWPPRDWWTSTS